MKETPDSYTADDVSGLVKASRRSKKSRNTAVCEKKSNDGTGLTKASKHSTDSYKSTLLEGICESDNSGSVTPIPLNIVIVLF